MKKWVIQIFNKEAMLACLSLFVALFALLVLVEIPERLVLNTGIYFDYFTTEHVRISLDGLVSQLAYRTPFVAALVSLFSSVVLGVISIRNGLGNNRRWVPGIIVIGLSLLIFSQMF